MSVTFGSTPSLQFALKTLWPQDRIKQLAYKDHPFLAMVQKNEDFYGENMYIVMQDRRPAGRSATFSTAKTISETSYGSPGGCRFLLTRAKDYAVFGLDTESMMSASRDSGALIRGYERTMQGAIEGLSASLATSLVRGITGPLGQNTSSTTVYTDSGSADYGTAVLTNKEDIVNFEPGMYVVFSTSATAITALNVLNSGTQTESQIVSVDRDAGTFRYSIGTAAHTNGVDMASKYIFEAGDFTTGSTGIKSLGLADWLPSSAPTSTSADFLGVIRSVDPVRRAGARIDISALNPEEGLATALTKMAVHNANPRTMLVNPTDYLNFLLSLGSKVETEYMSVATIGFETLKVRGPRGIVSVVGDADVPKARGYLLDMSSWTFHSMGAAPQVLDQDGAILHRAESSDLWQGRMVYFGNLACDAPGHNANVTLAS
jgi:hypothetical protein